MIGMVVGQDAWLSYAWGGLHLFDPDPDSDFVLVPYREFDLDLSFLLDLVLSRLVRDLDHMTLLPLVVVVVPGTPDGTLHPGLTDQEDSLPPSMPGPTPMEQLEFCY